jgi:hypothetical protein
MVLFENATDHVPVAYRDESRNPNVVDRVQLVTPEYGPLVSTCAAYGIRRSAAFALVRDGFIRSFTIGRKRFVHVADLRELPERLNGGLRKLGSEVVA